MLGRVWCEHGSTAQQNGHLTQDGQACFFRNSRDENRMNVEGEGRKWKLEGLLELSQCPMSMTVKTFSPSNIICFCQPNTVR